MFKVGDLVICVEDNNAYGNVTKGSIYKVSELRKGDEDLTYVIDNFGRSYGVFNYRFKLYEEHIKRKEVW